MVDRSRKSGIGAIVVLLIIIIVVSILGYYLRQETPSFEFQGTLASNLVFFLLINLNIIVVMILAFLVVKNIVKLVLDRRRQILGSRLRSRLVSAFVGLSLIPTILLFMVAKGMLERVMEGWFSPQVAASVDGAFSVARYHYDLAEGQVYRHVRHLSRKVAELLPYLELQEGGTELDADGSRQLVESYLRQKREEYGLFQLEIVNSQGLVLAKASSLEATRDLVEIPAPSISAVRQALARVLVVRPEQSIDGEFLRGYAPIHLSAEAGLTGGIAYQLDKASSEKTDEGFAEGSADFALVATHWVLPELNAALGRLSNAYDDYRQLKSYHRPLISSYFLTLAVVTLLIIFGAIWVGFYLARDLSVPIGLLAEGTQHVAHGNLDHHIPEVGDDELTLLVRAFNVMTKDLKETTEELVSRRRYMETVLARVGVGVISIDIEWRITTCNITAAKMLGIVSPEDALSKELGEVLPLSLEENVRKEIEMLNAGTENLLSISLSVDIANTPKHIQLTVTKLVDEQGEALGAVILLDEITELVRAQRMAAWREVARRIAHEIKNPLTPIQLNAERMQRKFAVRPEKGDEKNFGESERRIISEATDIIIKQVRGLRMLVNEFSSFARMPQVVRKPEFLKEVISDTVAIYREAHRDICFSMDLADDVPKFSLDREQINRALINLIDNGIASIQRYFEQNHSSNKNDCLSPGEDPRESGEIVICSEYDPGLGLVILSISDNGLGIDECDKVKLFEPYFTTKRGGTGLGLAIVRTIIADHNGFIRVRDNSPHGARFIIELPVERELTQKYQEANKA